jgi:hypothetical protein
MDNLSFFGINQAISRQSRWSSRGNIVTGPVKFTFFLWGGVGIFQSDMVPYYDLIFIFTVHEICLSMGFIVVKETDPNW